MKGLITGIKWGVAISIGMVFFQCAQVRPVPGGERDTTPPVYIAEASTPNLQTNFRKQPISLTFDEWVVLRNPEQQIVVSPPLEYPLKSKLRGRKLVLDFDERELLREDATYTINLGNAVVDYTENNEAENLRFVFSTGSYIDSLSVSGRLVDAYTGKPLGGIYAFLYENLSDTALATLRPFYFARTDSSGLFSIPYVRSDTFALYALDDKNANYQYDPPEELIGIFPEAVQLTDRNRTIGIIPVFLPEQALRAFDMEKLADGSARISFNREPDALRWELEGWSDNTIVRLEESYLRLYADTISPEALVYLWDNEEPLDTLFWSKAIPAADGASRLQLEGENLFDKKLLINQPLQLKISLPWQSLDSNRMQLIADSVAVPFQLRYTDSLPFQFEIQAKWIDTNAYTFWLLDSAVIDRSGRYSDSLRIGFSLMATTDVGNLLITIDSLASDKTYVIELLRGEDVLVDTRSIRGDAVFPITWKQLPPAIYSMRLIEDRNKNGRWDTGGLEGRRQPERIQFNSIGQLRPNWDLEFNVSWEE